MRRGVLSHLAVVLILMVLTFCSCGQYAGCRRYDSMTPESTHCRLIRLAVWDYVELTDKPDSQYERVYLIARLLEKLKQCDLSDCVDLEISADTIANGFHAIYLLAIQKAGKKLSFDKKIIILSGLENGLRDWLDVLKQRAVHDH